MTCLFSILFLGLTGLGTSKYYPDQTTLGCNGTFLASLAAVCLIHIVSRHHEHRSHNLLTAHHSNVIDRQLPAQPQHEIHGSHGTRVTVRNLFGNFPVRVKQRTASTEQRLAHGRLWAELKKEATGLLLAWKQPVSLKIRDGEGSTLINFTAPASRSSGLDFMLNLLTKANYVSIDDWSSWVPTAASTSTVSIKGAISLDPAPHKHVQFISLDLKNLSVQSSHNELVDQINRIFSLSSFGVVENDGVGTEEKAKRQRDKRFKHDGYTNRQLTVRKGVDRYPMFHLRIILKSAEGSARGVDNPMENKHNLQAVSGVLNAMITQWLSVHHFRPRKSRTERITEDFSSTSSTPLGKNATDDPGSTSEKNVGNSSSSAVRHSLFKDTKEPQSRKRKRRNSETREQTPSKAEKPQPFALWSRIKSGKVDFFETSRDVPIRTVAQGSSPTVVPGLKTTSIPSHRPSNDREASNSAALNQGHDEIENNHDGITTLTDPTTKQKFFLNARTGMVLTRPTNRPLSATHISPLNEYNGPLRLTDRPRTAGSNAANPWLDEFLKTWVNPVFKPTERGIEQTWAHEGHFDICQAGTHKLHNKPADISASKLSKTGLKQSHVLAQLDKKFILVKMQNSPTVASGSSIERKPRGETLVLIDQHAADERLQVELLLADLCKSPAAEHIYTGYRSQLGHQSRVAFVMLEKPIRFVLSSEEKFQFVTHAAKFAAWGILFNVDTSSNIATARRQQSLLSVTTLPPSISERSKGDPQVLISFLRSAVWKYTESEHSTQTTIPEEKVTIADDVGESIPPSSDPWVRQLSTCPEGLIELVNSRACRSAIMFNDELSLQDCETLVRKLADCMFPFICAHGRPSMVPLVDLGTTNVVANGVGAEPENDEENKGGFVAAWRKWKSGGSS